METGRILFVGDSQERSVKRMRLIDADALKAEIATIMPSRTEVFLVVDKMPDAIVRCKDCKWFEMPRYGERGFCKNVELIRRTTFYCADGEAKT